ncbi:HEAT repeat domain-containing protein [Pseudodesulfovibrio karagichevae]|uniref:HEAT repeat domain-containing protein n=1 Tax=Pseudodesulfovibrio karagichevae TaxID=3239305 RepID=A0ABV4K518_9BACT
MIDKNFSGNTLDFLMNMLSSKDGMARKSARESLVAMGAPAVPSLMKALQDSPSDKVRLEAAKSLGVMATNGPSPPW